MKNWKKLFRIIVFATVMVLSFAVCDNGLGSGNIDSVLVGKWYFDKTFSSLVYEFTSDGKVYMGGHVNDAYTFSASGGKMMIYQYGNKYLSMDYTVSGNELHLFNIGGTGSSLGKFYKR